MLSIIKHGNKFCELNHFFVACMRNVVYLNNCFTIVICNVFHKENNERIK